MSLHETVANGYRRGERAPARQHTSEIRHVDLDDQRLELADDGSGLLP